ncbi:MAG: exonuclease SbcC [Streptococcus sp.]|nr:exonuclease SbcC [Streptococcus sp.]
MRQKKFIGAYSRDTRDYFSLLPTEQEIVTKLKNIYRNEKGVFILCGNRGVGKSSLKNISLEPDKYITNEDKKNLVINVSFFSGNKDFYREILMQVPSAIIKRIEEIEHKLDDIVDNQQRIAPFPIGDEKIREYDLSEKNQIINRLSIMNKKLREMASSCHEDTTVYNLVRELEKQARILFQEFEFVNEQRGFKKRSCFKSRNREVNLSTFLKKIEELEKKIKELEKLWVELEKIQEFLQISQEQLYYFDIEITNTKKFLELTTSEVSVSSSIDLGTDLKIIKSGIHLQGGGILNETEENHKELRSIITDELKERQLFKLLKNMSEHFNITFSIDELDKCSTATIIEMIDKNKRLFFDCNISVLLITDVSTAISLEEESDYVAEPNIIVVPDLTVMDYIYRINNKGMLLSSFNFIDILNSYYTNKMNNRELNYSEGNIRKSRFSKGFELYKFMNSTLYRGLDQRYQSVVLKFYWELLDLLGFVEELSKEEYDQFENCFFERNDLHSLKVKFIVRKIVNNLVTNSFDYYFMLKDARSHYKHSKLLTEFNNKQNEITEFLKQLALRPTIISDDTAFLKLNDKDSQELYKLGEELSTYLEELGFDNETFRNILLQLSKPTNRIFPNNVNYRFADKFYDSSRGVEDARSIVERENTVGVILFYPYDYSEGAFPAYQPLRNGIIVTVNDFDEIVLYPYVGYIGLHSHKPGYLEAFKKELESLEIPIYEVEDESLWDGCFTKGNQNINVEILEVCRREIKEWLDKLRE